MKFEDYHFAEAVRQGLRDLGFKRPTDIQYKTIPHILKGEDVFAVAQTGTGKTGAYAIPIIHKIHKKKAKERRADGIQCIVMVPTHELAMQQEEFFRRVAKHAGVKVLGLIGGVSQDPQIATLSKRVDILIATPGRMFDLMSQGHLRVNRVNTLVLDEADHMLDLGFIKDIEDLCKRLPERRQTLFFSATINAKIKKLAFSIIKQSAFRIQFSPKDPVSKNVNHAVAFVGMDHKRFFLERMVKEYPEDKILVFVRTKVRAERVKKAMGRVGIDSMTIHSDKTQEERDQVMYTFRKGTTKLLVSTDVAARGIDIPDVDLVINYDLPDKAENYVHRIGRTGRGKQRGEALSFCAEQEKEMLREIESYIHCDIKVLDVDKQEYLDTLLFTDDQTDKLGALLGEIEALEERDRKRKKKMGR